MNLSFIYHILISAIIFYILVSGFKFFLKLRGTMDFSYLAIVIFGTYLWAILNIKFGIWILWAMWLSFLISMIFTFLVLFLSSKLDDVYFSIWTLTVYILAYQLALNMDWVTWWAFGMSGMTQNIIWNISLYGLSEFLIFILIFVFFIIVILLFIKRTYFYKILQWRGEHETVIKTLGIKIHTYKFFMIALTTLLAVVWWNLFWFYYLYIDPGSFRLTLLTLLVVIAFVSYKFNDLWTVLISVIVLFVYEYLRFFKIVDPSKIWYFREIIFAIVIMIVSFFIFRKVKFGRDH